MPSKCSSETLTSENLPVGVLRCSALPVTDERPCAFQPALHSCSGVPFPLAYSKIQFLHLSRFPISPTSLFLPCSTTISMQTCCSIFGPHVTPQLLPHFPAPFTAEPLKGVVYTRSTHLLASHCH